MSYKDSVYDITDFLKIHPGGADKILMAAGGPIEGFWAMYNFHLKDEIFSMLAPYKIGILHPDDRMKPEDIPDFSDI